MSKLLENRFPLFLRDFQELFQFYFAFQIELEGLVELAHQLFRGRQAGELIGQIAFLEDLEGCHKELIGLDEVRCRIDIAGEGVCNRGELRVAFDTDQVFDQLPGFGFVLGSGIIVSGVVAGTVCTGMTTSCP